MVRKQRLLATWLASVRSFLSPGTIVVARPWQLAVVYIRTLVRTDEPVRFISAACAKLFGLVSHMFTSFLCGTPYYSRDLRVRLGYSFALAFLSHGSHLRDVLNLKCPPSLTVFHVFYANNNFIVSWMREDNIHRQSDICILYRAGSQSWWSPHIKFRVDICYDVGIFITKLDNEIMCKVGLMPR